MDIMLGFIGFGVLMFLVLAGYGLYEYLSNKK